MRPFPAALRVVARVALCLAFGGGAAWAQEDPARLATAGGLQVVTQLATPPPDPARLVVSISLPAHVPTGPGVRIPLAVVLHAAEAGPPGSGMFGMVALTGYFLSRGYAVAQPMMRGFAGSSGAIAQQGCDLAAAARRDAQDVAAVLDDLRAAPTIDLGRVVAAGVGFGGWNALGVARLAPRGVRGAVSFFPGLHTPGCPPERTGPALIDGARALARHGGLPVLWVDAAAAADAANPGPGMLAAWHEAGGAADSFDVGDFMGRPRALTVLPEGVALWAPRLDAFLKELSLPATEQNAAYLPSPKPAASGFAAIGDVRAVPWIGDAGRATYAAFLTQPLPRVFAIAQDGTAVVQSGGYDPQRGALASCAAAGRFCLVYAYDGDVVWPLPPRPVASHYADIADVSHVPYIGDAGRASYRAFLGYPKPRVFVVSADGWITSHGADVAITALALCRARFRAGCAIYAIDDTVVWRPD